MATKELVPASREVRLADGVTFGVHEDLMYRAHTGSTGELPGLMAAQELLRQNDRLKGAQALSFLLHQQIAKGSFGNIGVSEIEQALTEFQDNEVLDLHPEPPAGIKYEAE